MNYIKFRTVFSFLILHSLQLPPSLNLLLLISLLFLIHTFSSVPFFSRPPILHSMSFSYYLLMYSLIPWLPLSLSESHSSFCLFFSPPHTHTQPPTHYSPLPTFIIFHTNTFYLSFSQPPTPPCILLSFYAFLSLFSLTLYFLLSLSYSLTHTL